MGAQRIKIDTNVTKDGRTRYVGMYAHPEGGFRSAGSFGRRLDAVNAATREADKVANNDWADPRAAKILLDQYVQSDWLKELPGTIEVTTQRGYVSTYNNHVKPTFGHRPLGLIRHGDVKKWISEMETGTGHYSKPVGRHTQQKAFVVLALILGSAKKSKVLRGDLATEGAKPLPAEDKDVKALTPTQYKAIFVHVPEHWRPLVQAAVDSGMRLNELRALTVERIDWNGRIRVAPGIVQVTKAEGENGSRFVHKAYPKGRKKRWAQVGTHKQVEDTMGVLADVILARGLGEHDTIFCDPDGDLITNEAVEDMWRETCEAAGVTGFAFKHLRSTCASWDLQMTGDVMFVKDKLGHASVTTTEKHYLNVIPLRDEESNLTSMEQFLARRRKAAEAS